MLLTRAKGTILAETERSQAAWPGESWPVLPGSVETAGFDFTPWLSERRESLQPQWHYFSPAFSLFMLCLLPELTVALEKGMLFVFLFLFCSKKFCFFFF